MGQSVVINPSGDPSGDFHPRSSQAIRVVVSSEAGDSGEVSKRSSSTYICQFCGRVCRNAQALGGHMNVHRRERALAKQLLDLRNQGEDLTKGKGTSAAPPTTWVVAAAAAAAATASGNPPAGEDTEQDLLQEEVITIHGGSSASSSSPPSPHSIANASALVHPWKSLHRLPSKNNRKRRETVDLELRLGFTPGRFL